VKPQFIVFVRGGMLKKNDGMECWKMIGVGAYIKLDLRRDYR
jgi:hypothetical protein